MFLKLGRLILHHTAVEQLHFCCCTVVVQGTLLLHSTAGLVAWTVVWCSACRRGQMYRAKHLGCVQVALSSHAGCSSLSLLGMQG